MLETFNVPGTPLYVVGSFNRGVTVLSQQTRTLNLVWALVESGTLPTVIAPAGPSVTPSRRKIAIVGIGFAGLTAAAALLRKGADAQITMFEQRDTLLPLQQGSDSRWLHPRIYDWPGKGSEGSAAMLPLLNWTAARASDVVVHILGQWSKIVDETALKPLLYCNARHLQIHEVSAPATGLRVEWVAEHRDPRDGTTVFGNESPALGGSQIFDLVILAIGFGPERDAALSYWRNETLAQPTLDHPRLTYLVSGQGDGAMIDLLRLRISQFRQDRILGELFNGCDFLIQRLEILHQTHSRSGHEHGLFDALERLELEAHTEFEDVKRRLSRRLRRDTDVILRLKVKKFSELFDPLTAKISFQNRLLVYLLYKCGGFFPSTVDIAMLAKQYSIPPDRIICRHGPDPLTQLSEILSDALFAGITDARTRSAALVQPDEMGWSGGYFGFPGPTRSAASLPETLRDTWRQEYLPGPTELLATVFCAAIAGALTNLYPSDKRLRVTLHRVAAFGGEVVLQQACDYLGTADAAGTVSAAARTFPAGNATIGLAYRCRRIVRSVNAVDPQQLNEAMRELHLNDASRKMSEDVGFVLAMPMLHPLPSRERGDGPAVTAVLYVDSTAPGFHIDDLSLRMLVSMAQALMAGLDRMDSTQLDRIQNVRISSEQPRSAEPLPASVSGVLELVGMVDPPIARRFLSLNLDYSDFVPVAQ